MYIHIYIYIYRYKECIGEKNNVPFSKSFDPPPPKKNVATRLNMYICIYSITVLSVGVVYKLSELFCAWNFRY